MAATYLGVLKIAIGPIRSFTKFIGTVTHVNAPQRRQQRQQQHSFLSSVHYVHVTLYLSSVAPNP